MAKTTQLELLNTKKKLSKIEFSFPSIITKTLKFLKKKCKDIQKIKINFV